ncbi:MAG: peroxiredoxin family protein [Gemmataceae bacterium]|nr:peroxiredoxin family protein [Gemmataceae bacterium]MDW8265400.1 redoxin domain-containing protein [Gemmataceae bacterium]
MVTILSALACTFAPVQPPLAERPEWSLAPQLRRGQELVYRGSFTEEALAPGIHFSREYALETRVFVLEASSQGAELAWLTIVRPSHPRGQRTEVEPCSVRLEVASLDAAGRMVPPPRRPLLLPLDGPPTLETGLFVESPQPRVVGGQFWDVSEPGRPSRTWKVIGSDTINGTACVKLVGVQQSDGWVQPRADRPAWRRQDTMWLISRGGYCCRLERIVEFRELGSLEPTRRRSTRYDLESATTYPGQLLEDRQREILLVRQVADSLAPLLPRAGQVGPKPFEAILARIRQHLDQQPPTPYRAALKPLQLRAEAGRRGESPPADPTEEPTADTAVLALGKPAPDFVVMDLTTNETARLRRWLGRPVVLLFYSPTSRTVAEQLGFLQELTTTFGPDIAVVALAVSEDTAHILRQREELKLTIPILSGTGLRRSFAVDATPKLVVLDADGIARASLVGWGPESPAAVRGELKRCLGKR